MQLFTEITSETQYISCDTAEYHCKHDSHYRTLYTHCYNSNRPQSPKRSKLFVASGPLLSSKFVLHVVQLL